MGSIGPGAVPSETPTSSSTVAAAASNAGASELPDPICDTDFAYGARGQIEPTVVISLTVAKGTVLRVSQGPNAVARAIDEFEDPRAVSYTHLDVYKRQYRLSAADRARGSPG